MPGMNSPLSCADSLRGHNTFHISESSAEKRMVKSVQYHQSQVLREGKAEGQGS